MELYNALTSGAAAGLPSDLLEHLPLGILWVGQHGLISYANTCAIATFSPVQPIGLSLRALFDQLGVANASALAEILKTGERPIALSRNVQGGRLTGPRDIDCRGVTLPDGTVAIIVSDVTHADMSGVIGLAAPGAGEMPIDRASLLRTISHLMAQSKALEAPLAFISICIDRFPTIIDELGHAIGDELLAKVNERLRSTVRGHDLVFHLGGEAFVVVQTNERQPEGAAGLAGRLTDLIGRTYLVKGQMLNVGANLGIAISTAEVDSAETLFRHADLALHLAKREGAGVARFYEPAMDVALVERRALELDLRKALILGQFELVYQPQYQLSDGTLTGFEALLRWRHPARGVISPALFVPLAEELGLIAPIGEWVLRTACSEAATWVLPASIAINVSPVQFRDNKLLGAVRSALAASGLAPNRLDIEITEGMLLHDTSSVLETLGVLRTLGVRVSMDDFGTGYSSISYLQKFPFDKIKIDQSFVRGADKSADSRAIINAVTALGASMGIKTVAEGVETDEQMQRMRASGCSEVQGYFTGRPMPGDAAAALVAAELAGKQK